MVRQQGKANYGRQRYTKETLLLSFVRAQQKSFHSEMDELRLISKIYAVSFTIYSASCVGICLSLTVFLAILLPGCAAHIREGLWHGGGGGICPAILLRCQRLGAPLSSPQLFLLVPCGTHSRLPPHQASPECGRRELVLRSTTHSFLRQEYSELPTQRALSTES